MGSNQGESGGVGKEKATIKPHFIVGAMEYLHTQWRGFTGKYFIKI